MTTFADLRVPFPLFEAPVDDASDFVGGATCSLCGQGSAACFELGIGCALMQECSACGTVNGLDASDATSVDCRACQQSIVFPDLTTPVISCYLCLRKGRAAITKDTELGMVSWAQAFEGVTHGIPGLRHADFELVPKANDWVGARLPQATMFELLRTPTYLTIQGDRWLFCCKEPMVFVGQWSREQFTRQAPDGDGQKLFRAIVEKPVPGLWEDELHDETGIYVFRCRSCQRLRAHWDLA